MARTPKPWFWKARRAWFVTIDGSRICLGREKQEAVTRFHELMAQPKQRQVSSRSLAAIADAFLEWVQKHRSPDTYEWYRYRLERFVQKYPDLRASEVRPYHVETWADDYPLSKLDATTAARAKCRAIRSEPFCGA